VRDNLQLVWKKFWAGKGAIMGYMISKLAHVPFDETVEFYIFIVGDGFVWEGGAEEIIHRNFQNIATSIGTKAIIVKGLDERFADEVCERYLGPKWQTLNNKMPALIITDAHPDKLDDKSMRLIIPLESISQNYKIIDQFFASLSRFVRGESDDLVKTLEKSKSKFDGINEIFIAEPTVCGFGVNLNAVAKRLRSWWRSKYVKTT
jgi:hypothetical protein